MTPGKWLSYSPHGARHVHSDVEMAHPLEWWRPGAACAECPHTAELCATVLQPTQVQRKPGVPAMSSLWRDVVHTTKESVGTQCDGCGLEDAYTPRETGEPYRLTRADWTILAWAGTNECLDFCSACTTRVRDFLKGMRQ